MVDILKEYRVEINKMGQEHYLIADGCVEAIKAAYEGYAGGQGIDEEDVTEVHCQFWRNVPHHHPPQTFTTDPIDKRYDLSDEQIPFNLQLDPSEE